MQRSKSFRPIYFMCLALVLTSVRALASDLAIRKHLTDASVINHERAPKYAELTSNASLILSHELIFMENLAKIGTIHLDLKAKKYMAKGIGLFNDDLVDMAKTPAFFTSFESGEAPTERVEIKIKIIKRRWLEYLAQDDLQSIYNEAVILLDEGQLKNTNQNCLTRHFVESIARSLMNHEGHREKSREKNLQDPKHILLSFLKIQIISLAWAQSLDKRAYPIQEQGVPFFCRDVPAVPYKPTMLF